MKILPLLQTKTILLLTAFWLLAGNLAFGQLGDDTAFYLDSSSYTAVCGTSITGTVYRIAVSENCGFACDWFPADPAYPELQIGSSGTYGIVSCDVTSNGGPYTFTIPANSDSKAFSIPLSNCGELDYDRTGTLNVVNEYSDPGKIQSASLTILDNHSEVGVGFMSGGTIYDGNTSILEGGTSGADKLTIAFFRNVSVTQARTVNYTISGTAIAGTDYSPSSFGTITIPQGTNAVYVTITATNSNQSVNKTLTVTINSGVYQLYPGASNMTVTIYNDYPTAEVYATNSEMIRGDTTSALVFYRDSYYANSGTARTFHYTVGGTANNGVDYTPTLSGTVTIQAGSGSVTQALTPAIESTTNGTKTLSVTYSSGTGYAIGTNNSASISILEDFPNVDVIAPPSMIRGDTTASVVFERETYYPGVSVAKTVNYTIAGSTASNGVDFTPSLSGTAIIPAGGFAVTNILTPTAGTTSNATKTLNISLQPGVMYSYGTSSNASISILEDFPNIDVTATPSMTRGESNASLVFYRETYYSGVSVAKTVNYTLAGSTAVNGVDYTPSLSGSAVIPAGGFAVTNVLTPETETNLTGTKILNVSLQPGTRYSYGAGSNTQIGVLEDAPMISVAASTPTAYQNGTAGAFTVTRTYGYPKSVTANFTLTGTAANGGTYTNLPLSVTFAAYQTVTNLTVEPKLTPLLTNAQTVVLTISSNSLYFLGDTTQAVVTIAPQSSMTNSVPSPAGRYWRGTGNDPTYWSLVVPLDSEKGVAYDNLFGNCSTLYPGLLAWNASTFYHYNATNLTSSTNWATRVPFNNPIVAFGERVGGTPLYLNQDYNFGIYAGDPITVGTPVTILAYCRTNYGYAGEVDVYPPNFSNTNSWNSYTSNGFQVTSAGFGLTTTLSASPNLSWGSTSRGAYELTHTASAASTNYYYVVVEYGIPNNQTFGMAQDTNGYIAPSYLYSLEFEQRPAWRAVIIDQPQFSGNPLPPFYAGMTLAELLTNTPPVTNAVSLSPSACTNIDQSPELRRSPILDQFVADMGNDPMALANYVLNNIDLTDPIDYNDNGNVSEESINLGGVSRGALGTFLEKQGSPVEECALLVYLLRQAGVPATYMYPPHNGLQILDARLSQMLKFQVHGAYSESGQLYSANTMIPVNYPWVAAYIGTNWVHIFPWLKDYEIVEGLNLYDYMPTNYSSAYGWIKDYIYGNSNLLSLGVNGDNTPRVIFPRYITQTLQQNYPGISLDDIGVQILNRPHNYTRWEDFPTPTWLTNTALTVESLTASSITNVDPLLTNIFDTVSVELYSETDPHKDIQTGPMRLTDLHNRQFYVTQTNNAPNQILLSLVLSPFRTNVATQYAFTNDASLLSKEVQSTTLDEFDDVLWVRITYNRHQALSPSYAIDPSQPYLGFKDSPTRQIVVERPLRKGDLAAICLNYGRVTQDMLNVHATDLWQMENTLRANPSASISPDVYQGATLYLAGMSYYKRMSDFDAVNQNLHKVDVLSSWAAGLSKLGPRRDSTGDLANGAVDPVFPNVDMAYQEVAAVGNETVQPNSGQDIELAIQNYNLIKIVDGSAQEHQVLNDFYHQTNAVSTVRLLQLSQSRGYGIVSMNINNYVSQGQAVYQGSQLQNFDPDVWNQVASTMQSTAYGDYGYIVAYMTAGPITNDSYSGVGALILGWVNSQAVISPFSLNGGFGENLPDNSVSPANLDNFNLTMDETPTLTFQPPSSSTTLLPDQIADFNTSEIENQILNSDYTATPYDSLWSSGLQAELGLSSQSTLDETLAQDIQTTEENGQLGSSMLSQLWSKVSDPVDNITGEFYVNETDLKLPGPIPLSLGRNYSSQNLANNQFGTGWKFSIMPYLSVAQGGTNIYAADMDGAVLNYVQTSTNQNLWIPTTAANPRLANNTAAGVGSMANRLRDRLVATVNGGTTNFALYGADGSVRVYQFKTFNNGILNQTRPYLLGWTNNCGNSYSFSYGTDPTQPSFGQVTRIQCSNGNYLGFYYDVYGHIIQAYSGDGRRLTYDYDEFGDLITVTLPDATTRSYQYLHAMQSVTNAGVVSQQPYSTHLIIEEDKPDGRVLQNAYDSQRRVTNQLSTAGTDLIPVHTATFVFANNFNLTNSPTNSITGYTLVIDGNGSTNRYDYTNSLIALITDPLGQTVQQVWYADNATAPGYSRSVFQRKDKRGLWTQYQYDSNGNVTNSIVTGDLTGNGILTQTATNTAVYNSNSLPLQLTDPVGNSVVYVYDNNFSFLPQQVIHYAGATPICTNYQIYGDATNIVTLGSLTQTNIALGLLVRQIRAFDSPDAATNDFDYNGEGFMTESLRYTGTSDPTVENTYYYDERNELVTQADALGATTEFTYDAMGRPASEENFDEMGDLLSWNFDYYDDNGELNWVDGPRYNPEDYIFYDHDGAGRVTTEINWRSQANPNGTGVEAPSGYNQYAQTFNQYDVLGNLKLKVDPRGAMTTNTWDALCRLVQVKHLDLDGVTVLSTDGYSYEPGGQVQSHTNALGGVTTTLYTTSGQPESQTNPDGSTNAWLYYLDGRVYRTIQRNGAYWQTTYDDVNRITTRVFYSAAGVPEETNSTQLDRRGNVIQKVDAGGNVFTSTYDGLDRPKATMGPAIVTVNSVLSGLNPGGTPTYVTNVLQQAVTNFYDAAGRAVTNMNALGERTITLMDALGRTTSSLIYNGSDTLVREKYYSYSADHNSVTVTDGSGSTGIRHTTYTDTQGNNVLSVAYPATSSLDYTWQAYDLSGNLVYQEHDTSPGGAWTFAAYTYDGLNRATSKEDRDYAVTSNSYDGLGDLTNRTIPGGLQWQATYNSARQKTHDAIVGSAGATSRENSYTYYGGGSSYAGMLDTKTDGRGLVSTFSYDDLLRHSSITRTDSDYTHVDTFWSYDPRGLVTNILEQNTGHLTGNDPKVISRTFDPYGNLSTEKVTWNGTTFSTASQTWDAAGRRTGLVINGADYGFLTRADGALVYAGDPTGSGSYGFDTAGRLTNRTVGPRTTAITSRDGEGRPLSITTAVSGSTQLTETMQWNGDGTLYSHTLNRADFTDSRLYSYASLSRRLTQEQVNLNATAVWTNDFGYDGGTSGGPGILTQMGLPNPNSADWNGGVSPLSRVNSETNTTVNYSAYGRVNGQSTLSLFLDSEPLDITTNGTGNSSFPFEWRTQMQLTPGVHQLKVAALDSSGFYTAWATNTFTNNIGHETDSIYRDNDGNIVQRIWTDTNGTQTHAQDLYFDVKERLTDLTDVDASYNGFVWHAEYDGMDRRLLTEYWLMTNGEAQIAGVTPLTIGQYYDPQVEFLELGVAYNNQTSWKLYGPDLNGKYGGLNGTGGLDGVSPYLNLFNPVISDFRGNILAEISNNVVTWNSARPTGYGAVPGYQPVALGHGADVAQSSAWRGRWTDITGYHWIGKRTYDPVAGMWLSYDSVWNERDPNYLSFAGGDPIKGFDADGRIASDFYNYLNNSSALNQWGQTLNMQAQVETGAGWQMGQNIANNSQTVYNNAISTGSGQGEAYYESGSYVVGSFTGFTSLYQGASGTDVATGQPITGANQAMQIVTGTAGVVGTGFLGEGVLSSFSMLDVAANANPLATSQNQAVFWSGIQDGPNTAAQWASANGGVTLEQTIAGNGVQLPAWDANDAASVAAWNQASEQFAAGASGDVTVLQSDAVRVDSIWGQTEFPALQANPNVTSVTAVNPTTGQQVLLWSR